MTGIDLKLDTDLHPRRLVEIGPHLVAFGGDDGAIVQINEDDDDVKMIRRWDDEAVRAVACCDDGRRVVVGLDGGSTLVYVYEDYRIGDPHPFCTTTSPTFDGQSQDMFLSQSDLVQGQYPHETVWAGPTADAPVRDMAFHPVSSKFVAVATEAGLSVTDVSDKDTLSTRYMERAAAQAHDESGVRSVCFGRVHGGEVTVLASLAMDGRLCLWNVSAPSPQEWSLLYRDSIKCVSRSDVGELLGADTWDRSCTPVFAGNDLVVLPGETFLQVRRISQELTVETCDLMPDGDRHNPVKGHIEGMVTFCLHQNSVISSGRDGRLVVWKLSSEGRQAIIFDKQIKTFETAASCLKYRDDKLYVALADGTMEIMSNVFPAVANAAVAEELSCHSRLAEDTATASRPSKRPLDHDTLLDRSARKTIADGTDASTSSLALPDTTRHQVLDSTDGEDDDDDDDNIVSSTFNPFVDDEAKDGDSVALGYPVGNNNDLEDNLVNELVDDDDDKDDDDDMDGDDDDMNNDFFRSVHHKVATGQSAATIKWPEPQPAFAPSATPLDLSRRYLCWNHLGAMTLHRGDDGRNTIEMNFTDAAFRRPLSFTDNMGFILGTVGEDGGLFATDLADDTDDVVDDDDGFNFLSETTKELVKKSQTKRMAGDTASTGSTLYFHRFETIGSARNKDWHLTLPDGERVLGCATGEGWAATVTSRRFVRLFSSGGNQGHIHWLCGEPVTCVGRGSLLCVTYHECTPLPDNTQKLGYLLMDVVANRTVARGSIASISPGSQLSWVGFSNDNSLLVMDSDGMLSMLVCTASDTPFESTSWEWMPVLDTVGLRKSADDCHWPVTVYDGKLVCVPLKGGTKYPDATRRPVTTTLGLRIPLARGAIPKLNPLEELSVRAGIALGQKKVFASILGNDDDHFEREYSALSAQVDKVTLKLFAASLEALKQERALDLTQRLHLEKSFSLAMTLAKNHRQLVDMIEVVRDQKFGVFNDEELPSEDEDQETDYVVRLTPDGSGIKRATAVVVDMARRVRQKIV